MQETKQKRYLRKFRENGGRVITVRLSPEVNTFLNDYIKVEGKLSINELINESLANHIGMHDEG